MLLGVRSMKPVRIVTSLLALLFLAACVTTQTPTAPQTAAGQLPIYSGDQLQITVLGETELTATYTVDETGKIMMPLIGAVAAAGRTTQNLASGIEAALRNGYLAHPDVTVQVAQYRPIFVLGEVGNPGQYAYVVGMTVQQAVALAGGYHGARQSERLRRDAFGKWRLDRNSRCIPMMLSCRATRSPFDSVCSEP